MRRSMAWFAAVLLLVATNAGAYAYQPGRTREPAWGTRFPDSVVCTSAQNAVIGAAFVEARRRVLRAIAFIDANPGHRHLRTWFGDGVRPANVRARLVAVAAVLQSQRRPRVYCGTQACGSFARSWRGHNTITLCTLFFRARSSGTDARFGVIIHELSHLVAGTVDHVYGPRAALALAAQDSNLAMQNADNLEYFVEHLPAR